MKAVFIWISMYFWNYSFFKSEQLVFKNCDDGHFTIRKWVVFFFCVCVCGHILSISGKWSRSSDSWLTFPQDSARSDLPSFWLHGFLFMACSKQEVRLLSVLLQLREVGEGVTRVGMTARNSGVSPHQAAARPSLPAAFENTLLERNSIRFKCSKVGTSCGFY